MLGLIRIHRVAEELEISERTVAEWISQGILRCHRVGRLVFFDRQEVVNDIKSYAATNAQADLPGEKRNEAFTKD